MPFRTNPMNPSILPSINIRWLTDPASADVLTVVPASNTLQRVHFPMPPEIGHAWLERLPLADDIFMFRQVHRFRSGSATGRWLPLGEFQLSLPKPALFIETVRGGTICHQEFHPRTELICKPGYDLFRYANRLREISRVDTSSDSEVISLILSKRVLAELIGEASTEAMIARLGLETLPSVKVLPMPIAISAPLREALSTQFQGALQRLFAQAKALEYLCALVAYTANGGPSSLRNTCQWDRLQELHDYLTHLEGKLPTLEELAVRFGMSARRLNEMFTLKYGLPIYAFITDWRLNEAYVAIRESDTSLKRLADRLGYSHVNHFNTAFRKKFGHPPGQLRRDRKVEDNG